MTMMIPTFLEQNFWFVLLVASGITFPLAWIADSILGDGAFGLIGNYVFLMLGALGGGVAVMLFIGSATQVMSNPHLPFFSASAGAACMILTACMLKRLVTR